MVMPPFILNAASPTEAELLIYGSIGQNFWDDESVSAASVVKQLASLPKTTKTITVRINSFGGSLSDGFAIYNALKAHAATVKCVIDGVAMSAASLIAMAGDSIEMPSTSILMIHSPSSYASGNAVELRKAADVLDKFADAMVGAYTSKSGKSVEDIKALLDGEDHFYTAAEALEAGFADVIIGGASATATAKSPAWAAAVTATFRAGFTPVAQTPPVLKEPLMSETEVTAAVDPAIAALKAELDALKASDAAERAVLARSAADAKAQLDAVTAQLQAEVEAKEVRAVVGEVTAAYPNLAIVAEEFGPALRAVRKAAPAAALAIEAVLKSANAVCAQLTEPKGSAGSVAAGTVRGQVDALIKAKRETDKSVSAEKAEFLVFAEHPSLYAALRAEQV